MKTTVAAGMAVGALAILQPVPSRAQSAAPSANDKVTIMGWALSMSNTATGANQTIRINIDRWSNPSQRQHLIFDLHREEAGWVAEGARKTARGRPLQLPRLYGPDPNNTMRLGTDIRYAMNHPLP